MLFIGLYSEVWVVFFYEFGFIKSFRCLVGLGIFFVVKSCYYVLY